LVVGVREALAALLEGHADDVLRLVLDAFHLAALTSMGLLIAGAAASGIGLRSERTVGRPEADSG